MYFQVCERCVEICMSLIVVQFEIVIAIESAHRARFSIISSEDGTQLRQFFSFSIISMMRSMPK